jgi:mannose-6-phosphate isomerase-like protein (cupin superfamily)
MTSQETQTVVPDERRATSTHADSEDITRNVISREHLFDGVNHLFQGKEHGGAPVSFFWVCSPPGGGPRLHKHPYQEIFVVQNGLATFTLGDKVTTVEGGHVVIAPSETPHKFVNSGSGVLELIAIHCSGRTIGVYLEN